MADGHFGGGASSIFAVVRFVGVLFFLLVATACSGGEEDATEPEPTPTPEIPVLAEDEIPQWEGRDVNPYDLDAGNCFNEYRWTNSSDDLIEITTEVECGGLHDNEVYFQVEHPADGESPFLGETQMEAWAVRECYEAFEGFVGQVYELSGYDIGTFQPTQETWQLGNHREITCFLFDDAGDQLQGTVAATGL